MALLQISEPGQSTAPHQHRLAAGIDLGTTNSLVASVRSGVAETLPDADGRHLLPSVVRYCAGGRPVVGDAALAAAVDDPLNTIASVKRLMGRGIDDVKYIGTQLPYEFVSGSSAMPLLHTAAGNVSPVEVSAEILRSLKARAEQTLGGELQGVVITVPAYFDEAQRQATKDAGRLAGLNVLRLLNEPTAAAVAYGLDKGAEGVIAIYDLGGGTFDISILRLNKGVFEVLSTAGDTALGGDDLDRAVADWIMQQAGIADDAGHSAMRHLMKLARHAKETLTGQDSVELAVTRADGSEWSGILSRATFEGLIAPLVEKTLGPCRRALRDAGVRVDEVQAVVMVGGSTRVPLVRARVAGHFRAEPMVDIDPDKDAVARRDPAVTGAGDDGRPDGKDHCPQYHHPDGARARVHHLQGRPDGHVAARGAGRARTGRRLPFAGEVRVARYSADGGRRRAHSRYLPGGCRRVAQCQRRGTDHRGEEQYRDQAVLRAE
jgi:molecular chaperone HscA